MSFFFCLPLASIPKNCYHRTRRSVCSNWDVGSKPRLWWRWTFNSLPFNMERLFILPNQSWVKFSVAGAHFCPCKTSWIHSSFGSWSGNSRQESGEENLFWSRVQILTWMSKLQLLDIWAWVSTAACCVIWLTLILCSWSHTDLL